MCSVILYLFIIVYDMSSLGTYNFLGYPWLRTHPICNFAHVLKLCSHKALLSITGLPRGKTGEKTAVGRVYLWCLFTFSLYLWCLFFSYLTCPFSQFSFQLQVNVPPLLGRSTKLHGYGQLLIRLLSKRSLHPYLKSVGGLSSWPLSVYPLSQLPS